jgi:hypothetical protein
VDKVSWRYALVMIVLSILLMLAMMLFPDFAAWVRDFMHHWRRPNLGLALIVIALCGGFLLITTALTWILRARFAGERIRRGQDASVLKPP